MKLVMASEEVQIPLGTLLRRVRFRGTASKVQAHEKRRSVPAKPCRQGQGEAERDKV